MIRIRSGATLSGVVMYLDPAAVENCLKRIRQESKSIKSRIFLDTNLDFSSLENACKGVIASDPKSRLNYDIQTYKNLLAGVQKMGEPWKFGIPVDDDYPVHLDNKRCNEAYFELQDYQVVNFLDRKGVNEKYFTMESGELSGSGLGFCDLVLIEVA